MPLSQCIRGAGRAPECAPVARGRARERIGEGRGHRAERQHRRWYCIAEYCGSVGSRHFERVPLGTLFFLRLPYSLHDAVQVCTRCAGEIIVSLWLQSFGANKSLYPTPIPFFDYRWKFAVVRCTNLKNSKFFRVRLHISK